MIPFPVQVGSSVGKDKRCSAHAFGDHRRSFVAGREASREGSFKIREAEAVTKKTASRVDVLTVSSGGPLNSIKPPTRGSPGHPQSGASHHSLFP